MVRELGRFFWTMLTVWVLSRHYFCADILDWEITTVVTVKTLASNVKTPQVRNSFFFSSMSWHLPLLKNRYAKAYMCLL